MLRHFVELFDLTPDEARTLVDRALERKRANHAPTREVPLAGQMLGLIFEKPSLRTRVSFEAAISQLGGNAIFLSASDVGLGSRESIPDFARVISQYVDALAVRTFSHHKVEELASHASVPIINALSDSGHPCQAMADMLTLRELLGHLEGRRLVFVGDGNNVARSLAIASALLGVEFVLACPEGYQFPDEFRLRFAERFPNVAIQENTDAAAAVAGADAVYTDVWASMGQEAEAQARRRAFAAYQVDEALMERARPDAVFLHCLPAHRGEEVSEGVLDGPQSQVILQAANRLHFQKELLVWLLLARKTASGDLAAARPGARLRPHPGRAARHRGRGKRPAS